MTDLERWLSEIEARVKANTKYATEFQFAVHDKVSLIGQTSALHMCLGERLADLARLVKALRKADACLHYYAKAGMLSDSPAALARSEIAEILKGGK